MLEYSQSPITKLSDESQPWAGQTGKPEESVSVGAGLCAPCTELTLPLTAGAPTLQHMGVQSFSTEIDSGPGIPSPNPPSRWTPLSFVILGQPLRWTSDPPIGSDHTRKLGLSLPETSVGRVGP